MLRSGIVALLAFLIAFTGIVPFRHNVFDLYPHWIGGRVFWAGESPYTEAVTQTIQMGYYGRLVGMAFDQHNSAYPAYNYLLLAPLLALPFPLAVSVWMAVQAAAIAGAVIVWTKILNWPLPAWKTTALILMALVGYRYSVTVFLLAQFTGWVLLLLSLGLLAALRGKAVLAGVLMACATMPPTMAAPLALLLLVMLRQWKALMAFTLTLSLLFVWSVAHIGWWLPAWLDVLGRYGDYAKPLIALSAAPLVIRLPIMAGVGLLLFRQSAERVESVVVLAVLAVLLVVPQTGIYYLLLLLPVLLIILRSGHRWAVAHVTVLLLLSWVWQALHLRELESLLVPLHVWFVWRICRVENRTSVL